jgi:hypothetical protein
MAYASNGEFNVLYPTRRKMANVLKKIILREGLIDYGTLYESVRINAKVPALGNLEIQIIAMYYFGFLNNGANLWNGGVIEPFLLCAQLTTELDNQGITNEIYAQYTDWLTKRYPILQVATILESQKKITYSFEPIGGSFTGTLTFRG